MNASCCYVDQQTQRSCGKDAEYIIQYSPDPYDYSESCTEHVGVLLSDDYEQRISPLKRVEAIAS